MPEATFDTFNMSKKSNITLYTVLCKSHKPIFCPFDMSNMSNN